MTHTRQNSKDTILSNPETRPGTASTTNWKDKRSEFRDLLENAKEAVKILKKGGDLREIPFKYSSNPDYVACQHCLRKFARSKWKTQE